MVAFSVQNGSGVMDTLMKTFTAEKYPNERHAYSLDVNHFMQPYSFVGPQTRLDIRLNADETPKPNSIPLNDLDSSALKHDLAYKHELEGYNRDHNKLILIMFGMQTKNLYDLLKIQGMIQLWGKLVVKLYQLRNI